MTRLICELFFQRNCPSFYPEKYCAIYLQRKSLTKLNCIFQKLESQLRDVAYGTRQYRIQPPSEDVVSWTNTLHIIQA